ncbi:putative septum site-determining protein MinC [Sporotomaculum syntrophicum]|uniref:Probable septum site-determining protein MinC n=1 Tax=Sporotomaculum syntrophicum TaxID=182264 RepID=A0A9D3AYC4_9FIRM|nr:septum site-determining protein MinC [Sporotomaculum syntrophicum]KAF1084628.1 putative septum site-determining protein MinC [Sporotomaculum syntrophicum]
MAKEAINIKGTKQGLIILLDPKRDFEDIKKGLKNKMESSSGFFSGAKFTLYRENQLFPAEKTELESICKAYGLIPNPDAQWPPPVTKTNHIVEISVNENGVNRYSLPGEAALLVKHTLRSGQMVNYSGHVTVLGNIHPGAKVLADGNIIVMGTCSGFVHAGQFGNQKAYIMALRIKNAHLRIAEQILSLNQLKQIGPVIARINNNKITLADYSDKRI